MDSSRRPLLAALATCVFACGTGEARPPMEGPQAPPTGDVPSDPGFGPGGGCINLECRQKACVGGATTKITGKILAPTAANPDPLPGVTVYVPNANVEPFAPGVACTTCASPPTGSPLVTTTTKVDGTFVLENVPVGANVPLVIQTGRWRRQVVVPHVNECVDNPLPADLGRLPRTKTEGDIPKMALVTGTLDALECMLAKMVDVSEITASSGNGRIHLYRQNGMDMSTPVPGRASLLASLATLKQYDAILLPCPSHEAYTADEAKNLKAYAEQGGRILNTHGGGFWMLEPAPLFPSFVTWNNQPDPGSTTATIDTTFAKGATFAKWLHLVGASSVEGQIPIGAPQWFVDAVQAPAQRWVYTTSPGTIQHFTFNTPVNVPEKDQCGRVLFSNFHVSGSAGGSFPAACTSGALTKEEQIIEYMLFDVTACVKPDGSPN